MQMRNLRRTLLLIPSRLGPFTNSRAALFTTRAGPLQTALHGRETSLIGFRSMRFLGAVSIPQPPARVHLRCFSAIPTNSSMTDPSPNWSNRPPKETILLDGCDYEHWLIVMEPPEGNPTRDEIIDRYIKTLAQIVGRWGERFESHSSVFSRFLFYTCLSFLIETLVGLGFCISGFWRLVLSDEMNLVLFWFLQRGRSQDEDLFCIYKTLLCIWLPGIGRAVLQD